MKRDLVSFALWKRHEFEELFTLTRSLQKVDHANPVTRPWAAALVFERESLRTRVSFEVGISQLGGHPIFLQQETIGMATRESVHDIGVILSQYCDLIIARTIRHQTCVQLAESATVPVINALTDLVHPCQILADAYTLKEHARFEKSTRLVLIGDGNNIVNSWLEFAAKFPLHIVCACPAGHEPHPRILEDAQSVGISTIDIMDDPVKAAQDADVIYTDVWPHGGGEAKGKIAKVFRNYQVDARLLRSAKPDCLVMHRLPANRGEEITSEVLDGPQSLALEQARNRLDVQKAIMMFLRRASDVTSDAPPR
jgi:ornithine carbamoyltransferase